jgi:hypothetical protein
MIPRISIALAVASVLPAGAATLLSTGFESPTYTTGPIAGQNGWAVFGTSVAAQVESGVAQSGSQAVEVIPSLASGQTGPYYGLSTSASIVEMSAYIYVAGSSNQSVWQFAATGAGLVGFIGGIDIQSNGAIDLITLAGTDVGTFNYNAWQLADFVFNFTTQTYNFSLNGTLLSSGVPFCGANGTCTGANVPSFGDAFFDTFPATSANDIGYMDNITISSVAPEPGSLMLLGAGLAALIACRVEFQRRLNRG